MRGLHRLTAAAAAAAAALLLQPAAAQPQPPTTLQPVRYYSYGEMLQRMRALVARAPQFARLYSAQERHGLQSPGECGDEPCAHWVLEITNFGSANASDAWGGGAVRPNDLAHRPQVFLSGNLHGDEQVGPMTLIYAAELLVDQRAAGGHPWVDRTVDTRRLLVMPMTNPLGYHRVQRSENGMDPNRDFPFRQAPAACMTTLTARAVNEVWRENLVTAALTFHGGMQAIGYEWGSENHMDHASESPDDRAQFLYTHVMANMAGALRGERYPVNRINSIVYPVDGGMEDWAYGGSWDAPSQVVCAPRTYGGYPPDKTTYNDAQLRAFNVIIEASDAKRPDEASLGAVDAADPVQALAVEGDGDGHVPRNMRLTLAAVDLVAPYVHVTRTSAAAVTAAAAGGGAPARRLGGGATSAAGPGGLHASSADAPAAAAAAAAGAPSARGEEEREGGDPMEEARLRAPGMARRYAALQQLAADEAAAARVRRRRQLAAAGGSGVEEEESAHRLRVCRRQLSVGGAGPSLFAGYSTGSVAVASSSSPGSFTGPGACVAAASGGACGSAHRGEYTHWLSLPAASATTTAGGGGGDDAAAGADAGAGATVKVGWDVGGAVSVDATSLLVGSWDVRVPPRWLTGAPVHAADNVDARAADATKAAAAGRLAAECGLSPAEAAAFVDYLHAWQLFAAGRVTLAGLPPGVALRHSAPRHGVTRWVFGSLGAQPPRNVDGASVLLGERVEGAPDLARAPFVTRFADCFRAALPRGAGAGAAPVVGDCADEAGAASGGARGLQDEPAPPAAAAATPSSSSPAVFFALLAVPYAAVDANWREQSAPEPAGTPPQSHMVNARTTGDWHKENNGFVVQGRLHAVGQPVFVGVEVAAAAAAAADAAAGPAAGAVSPSPSASASASSSAAPSGTASSTASGSASSVASPAAASVVDTPSATASVRASESASPSGSSSGTPSGSASVSPPSPSGSVSSSSAAEPAAAAGAAPDIPAEAPAPSSGGGLGDAGDEPPDVLEEEDDATMSAGEEERPPAVVAASSPPPASVEGDGGSSGSGAGSGAGSSSSSSSSSGVRMAPGAQVALLTASVALLAYFGAAPAARFVRALVVGGGGGSSLAAQTARASGAPGLGGDDEDEDDDDGLDEEAHQLVDAGATGVGGRRAGGGGARGAAGGGGGGARGSYTRGPGRPSRRGAASGSSQ